MKETATPNNVEIHCEKSIQMPVKNTLFEISAKIIVQKSLAKTVKKNNSKRHYEYARLQYCG